MNHLPAQPRVLLLVCSKDFYGMSKKHLRVHFKEGRTISSFLERAYLDVNGIKMHYVVRGSGELVLLLHGFPDFWYSWRHQIPALSEHFRVVAPDLRGYNETDKPVGIEAYSASQLIQDTKALINALGKDKAMIVGHDWGGAVAWYLAMLAPEYVKKLVILNCPHPFSLVEAFLGMKIRQLQKSWYIFFFQLPEIPEKVLARNNYEFLKKLLMGSTLNKEAFSAEDLEKYVEAWSKPGALTASINYYRANMNIAQILMMSKTQQELVTKGFPKVKCPTLVIWGEGDAALDKSLTFGMEKYVQGPYEIKYIQNCGHWVQLETPKIVNKYLLDFLRRT